MAGHIAFPALAQVVTHHVATAHAIAPGDVVTLAGANGLEWAITAIIAVKAGAI